MSVEREEGGEGRKVGGSEQEEASPYSSTQHETRSDDEQQEAACMCVSHEVGADTAVMLSY